MNNGDIMASTFIQLTKKAFSIRHKLKYYMVCYIICIGVMPLISLGFIDIITKKLTVNSSIAEIALVVFVFFICEGLSKILAIYSESKADTMITFIRMAIQNELNEKIFQIDYRFNT